MRYDRDRQVWEYFVYGLFYKKRRRHYPIGFLQRAQAFGLANAGLIVGQGVMFIVAGAAAIRASKSVTCVSVSVPDGNSGLVYRCILAGGRTPIANGAVAVLSFTALANAQPGRYVLRVTRIEAVGRDVKGARLKDASSEILISK